MNIGPKNRILILEVFLNSQLSYTYLEHATDAFIEVRAPTLEEAFNLSGQSVVDTTLDINTVDEKDQRTISVTGKNLYHLLFNWLEEINFLLITEGFSIRRLKLELHKNDEYTINATAFGEEIDLEKHHFKVEIKAPTFHMMEIKQNGEVILRFLLDL